MLTCAALVVGVMMGVGRSHFAARQQLNAVVCISRSYKYQSEVVVTPA